MFETQHLLTGTAFSNVFYFTAQWLFSHLPGFNKLSRVSLHQNEKYVLRTHGINLHCFSKKCFQSV